MTTNAESLVSPLKIEERIGLSEKIRDGTSVEITFNINDGLEVQVDGALVESIREAHIICTTRGPHSQMKIRTLVQIDGIDTWVDRIVYDPVVYAVAKREELKKELRESVAEVESYGDE